MANTRHRGLAILLTALALLASIGGPAHGHAAPTSFAHGDLPVVVQSDGGGVRFHGHVKRVVYFSDDDQDEYRLMLTGKIFLETGGCAGVRIEYIDHNGEVQEVDESDTLAKPYYAPGVVTTDVIEADRGKSHLDVRITLRHGSTCQSLSTVGIVESDLPWSTPNLGSGGFVALVPHEEQDAPSAATIDVWGLLGIVANPAGTHDEVMAMVSAEISWWAEPSPPRCSQLEAIAVGEGREEIDREWMGASCDRRTTSLGSAMFTHPKIERVVVRRHTHVVGNDGIESSWTNVAFIHLHHH